MRWRSFYGNLYVTLDDGSHSNSGVPRSPGSLAIRRLRKIDFGPGYRVYFGRDGESIVILRGAMALTRDFKDTVVARAQRDPRFRELLFTEAINAYLGGDTAAGKAILRDLVNATVGFEELAAELNKPSKSLHRMLAPRGNPSTENFFSIVSALQKKARVRLRVTAKAG